MEATVARDLCGPSDPGGQETEPGPLFPTACQLITFEGLATDLAEVGPALLVAAGHVPQEGALLREALLTELTAERPLTRVGAVVLVQTGCGGQGGAQLPSLAWDKEGMGLPHLGCGRSSHRGGTGKASRPCVCAGAC